MNRPYENPLDRQALSTIGAIGMLWIIDEGIPRLLPPIPCGFAHWQRRGDSRIARILWQSYRFQIRCALQHAPTKDSKIADMIRNGYYFLIRPGKMLVLPVIICYDNPGDAYG